MCKDYLFRVRVMWLKKHFPSRCPLSGTRLRGWNGVPTRPKDLVDALVVNWTGQRQRGIKTTPEQKLLVEKAIPWWKDFVASRKRKLRCKGRLTSYNSNTFSAQHHEWKNSCARFFLHACSKLGRHGSSVLALDAPYDRPDRRVRLRLCNMLEEEPNPLGLKVFVVDRERDIVRLALSKHSAVVSHARQCDVLDLTPDDFPHSLSGAYLDLCSGEIEKAVAVIEKVEPYLAATSVLAVTLIGRSYTGGTFAARIHTLWSLLGGFRGFKHDVLGNGDASGSWTACPDTPVATIFVARRGKRRFQQLTPPPPKFLRLRPVHLL